MPSATNHPLAGNLSPVRPPHPSRHQLPSQSPPKAPALHLGPAHHQIKLPRTPIRQQRKERWHRPQSWRQSKPKNPNKHPGTSTCTPCGTNLFCMLARKTRFCTAIWRTDTPWKSKAKSSPLVILRLRWIRWKWSTTRKTIRPSNPIWKRWDTPTAKSASSNPTICNQKKNNPYQLQQQHEPTEKRILPINREKKIFRPEPPKYPLIPRNSSTTRSFKKRWKYSRQEC